MRLIIHLIEIYGKIFGQEHFKFHLYVTNVKNKTGLEARLKNH